MNNEIPESITLKLNARAHELKKSGHDVINLASGQPDFDTPDHIKMVAIKAMIEGDTKYTDVAGVKELREAIIEKYKKEYGLVYGLDEVLVSFGVKHAIDNLFSVLVQPGDEVVLPNPYWVSFFAQCVKAKAKEVIPGGRDKNILKVTAEDIEREITQKTKLVILNSPSNPTGLIYSSSELRAIGEIIMKNEGVYIGVDEIYEKIIFDDYSYKSFLQVNPELRERTFIFNGVSKSYAMTGWRIGYTLGPSKIIQKMKKEQSHATSCTVPFAQQGAITAISDPRSEEFVKRMAKIFQNRRNSVCRELELIDLLRFKKPQGAFYVFPDVSAFFNKKTKSGRKIEDSSDLCYYLLEEYFLVVVPGQGFGNKNNVRISFSVSDEDLKRGVSKLKDALKELV